MTSILKRQPSNPNNLQKSKFKLVFAKVSNVEYFCQSVQLPGISSNPVPFNNPFATIKLTGDDLKYEPLVVNIILDEDLRTWTDIYDWIRGYSFPHEQKEYTIQARKGLYSDATLYFLTNSNEANIRFKFHNLFPFSISPVLMDSSSTGQETQVAQVQFTYQTFEVERAA